MKNEKVKWEVSQFFEISSALYNLLNFTFKFSILIFPISGLFGLGFRVQELRKNP